MGEKEEKGKDPAETRVGGTAKACDVPIVCWLRPLLEGKWTEWWLAEVWCPYR